MPDDLDDDLAEWGRSATPPVDGAFANRLETSLRSTMLDRTADGAGWAATIFRPGVVVMAIALLIFGFAFVSGDSDEPGFADDGTPLDESSTTVDPDASDTIAPTVLDEPSATTLPEGPDDPPQTDAPGPGTIVQPEVTDRQETDQTTVPPGSTPPTTRPADRDATTAPETTTPRQDTISSTTTWPPGLLVIEGTVTADGRRIILEWTVAGETSPISGWVIQRTVGERTAAAATLRDPESRTVSIVATDRQETYRIEARAEEGVVLGASDELSLSPDE
ncbi:MAG: hypothetical protein R8J94_10230 [Acidimicrobiia bacterium]|nr:hypothetical protein [Acidimicrobiia bacterium]